nr:hypothetical protein [Pandoravirus massiliensis]
MHSALSVSVFFAIGRLHFFWRALCLRDVARFEAQTFRYEKKSQKLQRCATVACHPSRGAAGWRARAQFPAACHMAKGHNAWRAGKNAGMRWPCFFYPLLFFEIPCKKREGGSCLGSTQHARTHQRVLVGKEKKREYEDRGRVVRCACRHSESPRDTGPSRRRGRGNVGRRCARAHNNRRPGRAGRRA